MSATGRVRPVEHLTALGLDAESATAAWEFVRSLDSLGRPLAVLLGGSIAAGLSNAGSDVDFVLVLPQSPPPGTALGGAAGRRAVNVSVFTEPDLHGLVTQFSQSHLPAGLISDASIAVVQRIRALADVTGGTVLAGKSFVRNVRTRFVADTVRNLVVEAFAFRQGNVHADAGGAAESHDWSTAIASAELAIDAAAEATLARAGDFYPARKFLPRRLKRLDPAVARSVARMRVRLARAASGDRNPAVDVMHALAFATDLSAAALLDWQPSPRSRDASARLRSPGHCVAQSDAGFLITGRGHYPVSRAVAETWLAHDGRGDAAVVRLLSRRWGRDAPTVSRYVEKVAGELEEAGLLTRPAPTPE
jgi:hypothetical protein